MADKPKTPKSAQDLSDKQLEDAAGGAEIYLKVKLEKVRITSYQTSGAADDDILIGGTTAYDG